MDTLAREELRELPVGILIDDLTTLDTTGAREPKLTMRWNAQMSLFEQILCESGESEVAMCERSTRLNERERCRVALALPSSRRKKGEGRGPVDEELFSLGFRPIGGY